MRNEQHCEPLVDRKPSKNGKKPLSLACGQVRGRLVEQKQRRTGVQRTSNLDQLPFMQTQVRNEPIHGGMRKRRVD